MGQLLGRKRYKLKYVFNAFAIAFDRLCFATRTLPHHRNEPQRTLLGIDEQSYQQQKQTIARRTKKIQYAISFIFQNT